MSDNINKKGINNKEADKDINLLPEKLRLSKRKINVSQIGRDDIRYTKAREQEGVAKESSSNFWLRVKGWVGRLRGRALSPLGQKSSTPDSKVNSPASPIQKLYAQGLNNQPPVSAKKIQPNKNYSRPLKQAVPEQKKEDIVPKVPLSSPESASKIPASAQSLDGENKPAKSMSMLEKIDQQLQKGIHLKNEETSGEGQFGVNLIPEELVVEVNPRRISNILGLTAALTILFVGLIYLVIDLVQLREAREVKLLQERIQVTQDEFISNSKDLSALVGYQHTYDNIKSLLSTHLYWTRVLDFFEKNVTDQVYFKDITADKNGLVNLSVIAEDYMALAEQYLVFKQSPGVTYINVTSAKLETEDGEENIDLTELGFLDETGINATSTATSTTGSISTSRIILDAFQNMPVQTRMSIQLDQNIFYKSSTSTANIVK